MNVDYLRLADELEDGSLRQHLEDELTVGFRMIAESGERLPLASHYASQIAEIVDRDAPVPLTAETKYILYQEILLAVERARATVLGEG